MRSALKGGAPKTKMYRESKMQMIDSDGHVVEIATRGPGFGNHAG